MTENPIRDYEQHPLNPLSRMISGELLKTLGRLEATNYGDINEVLYQVFLQDEAKDRVNRVILTEIGYAMPGRRPGLSLPFIADPKERKNYEKGWNKLFLRARIKPMTEAEMLKEIDSLFEVWKTARKSTLIFGLN